MKNIENTNWESRFDEAFPMQVYVFREHDMTMRVVCQGNPCTLHPTHERAAKDIKDFIRTLLHDTEIAAREKGMRENAIKIDEFFADGILHGTDEASKMVRETIIAQAKKIAREEIKKEIDLAITQVHGGGNGRRLLEQLRDALSH